VYLFKTSELFSSQSLRGGLYDKKCGEFIACLIGNLFLESLVEVQSVWGNSRKMAIRYTYPLPCFLPKNLKKSEIVVNITAVSTLDSKILLTSIY
jgi:hypothetical protein